MTLTSIPVAGWALLFLMGVTFLFLEAADLVVLSLDAE